MEMLRRAASARVSGLLDAARSGAGMLGIGVGSGWDWLVELRECGGMGAAAAALTLLFLGRGEPGGPGDGWPAARVLRGGAESAELVKTYREGRGT